MSEKEKIAGEKSVDKESVNQERGLVIPNSCDSDTVYDDYCNNDCKPCNPYDSCHPGCNFDPSCLQGIEECLCDIGGDIRGCEALLFKIGHAIFSPTFGLSEIKAEVSGIETAINSTTFGLSEIKAEISDIHSAVFNPEYGLQEIKSEVSAILGQMPNTEGFFRTTGPFVQTINDPAIEVSVFNTTNVPQSVTFYLVLGTECSSEVFTNTGEVPPCCISRVGNFLDFDVDRTIALIAEMSSSTGLQLYANTRTSLDNGAEKVTVFKAEQWLPIGTLCSGD